MGTRNVPPFRNDVVGSFLRPQVIHEARRNLEGLEPFGQGNEKPQFAQKNLRIRSVRAIGRNNNAVRMTVVTEQGRPMEAMVFTVADQFVEEAKQSRSIDVIYYPDINEIGRAHV